ncbi:MAG TPA: DUF664 domain-containing protein [Streptosporangiaceae bacterium]|nr:DUF664 domain-containing protein [Streptosporangiaceae bacterium]
MCTEPGDKVRSRHGRDTIAGHLGSAGAAIDFHGPAPITGGGEQHWFRNVMAGQNQQRHYRTEADRDADFNGAVADPDVVAEAWATWRSEIAFAEQFVTGVPDLDVRGAYSHGDHSGSISLRQVLVHMIEEYARHMGHADILRERIDGRVGQ